MNTLQNFNKILAYALLAFVCGFFQQCKDPDTVAPVEGPETETNDIMQKIKSLGFTENQIKETPNYYLVDGDIYFSKKISKSSRISGKKTGHRILEKYVTLTIRLDESLAGDMTEQWRAGIDEAIAEWNGNKDAHFHFALTTSVAADINVIKDTDLPKDLAIASEFPRDGRTGSSIRINADAKKLLGDPKQNFKHALEHCMGIIHSISTKKTEIEVKKTASNAARGPRYIWELYAIQDDNLWRVDAMTGEYYMVNGGWAGSEVMGQLDGLLYIVQYGTLWAVDPSTGDWTPLTGGWEGSQYITCIPDLGKLYIMQDSWIWPVDPETGLWDATLGSFSLARGLNGLQSLYDDEYRLAVLRRKPNSSVTSLFYLIDPSNGDRLLDGVTIKASGTPGWNKKFFMTCDFYDVGDVVIFNGKMNMASVLGSTSVWLDSSWPEAELATSIGDQIFLINKGTLYKVDWTSSVPNPPHDGAGNSKRLGPFNAWTNTSCLVFLE